jgi:hypothetical protein
VDARHKAGHDENSDSAIPIKMCGMIAVAIISGANLILVKGPRANVDLGHAACRHVRACRLIGMIRKSMERFSEKSSCPIMKLGRQPACDASCSVHWEDVASRIAAAVRFKKIQIKKPAAGFPARALKFLRW